MKVLILWSHLSGYMAASWRALAAVPGVEVFVLAFQSDSDAPFDAGVLGDVPHRLLTWAERNDVRLVQGLARRFRPDAILVGGWNHKAYRAVVTDRAHVEARTILGLDTQLRLDWRQAVGRRLLRGHLKHIDRVAVAGERAAMYARYLGFDGTRIRFGLYGVDFAAFASILARRLAAGPWPKRFLYVGRYAAEKDLDTLLAGYAQYRVAAGAGAWELVCCGAGSEKNRVRGDGVTDLGFVPPDRQADVFANAGVLVMPSRYEPWGVAIAEGACVGLPLICSDACGAAADVLRDGYNGRLFAAGDPTSLARAMAAVTHADLPTWGERSRALGAAFDARSWPQRVFEGLLPTSS